MRPLCHPSALQRSGKQASLTESCLEPSLAQQASRGGSRPGGSAGIHFLGCPRLGGLLSVALRGGTLGGVTHAFKNQKLDGP